MLVCAPRLRGRHHDNNMCQKLRKHLCLAHFNGNGVTLVGNGLKFTVAKRLINLVIYSYSLPVILIL